VILLEVMVNTEALFEVTIKLSSDIYKLHILTLLQILRLVGRI
jgi:hypothetical protein